MFGATCLVNQQAGLVVFSGEKMTDGAFGAMFFTCHQVDMTMTVEGGNQVITDLIRSVRKIFRAAGNRKVRSTACRKPSMPYARASQVK